MYFTSVNESAHVELFDPALEVGDIGSIARSIEMECALFGFESTHIAVESFHSAVLEDGAEAAASDDKSRFDKFKEKAGAIKDKFLKFLKNIWQKIKDMFTKVIYWISTKISSNKDFAAKYEKENLGKVKVKYDYTNSFKNISTRYPQLVKAGNDALEGFKNDRASGSSVKTDLAANDMAEVVSEELGLGTISNINDLKDAYRKAICIEKEGEADGKQLVALLKSNAPTVEGFKKFNAGVMNFFKAIEGRVKNPKGDISVKVGINWWYKLASLISSLVSTTIVSAQKLILAIRSDIKKSVNGGSSAGEAGKSESEGAAKPAEGASESTLFSGLLESLA
jgi:hypothetical protein